MNLNAWVPWLRKSVVYSLSLNGLWKLTGTFKTQRDSEWNVTSQSCMHMNASTPEHTHLHVSVCMTLIQWFSYGEATREKQERCYYSPKQEKLTINMKSSCYSAY